jgi:hypothetical protein
VGNCTPTFSDEEGSNIVGKSVGGWVLLGIFEI